MRSYTQMMRGFLCGFSTLALVACGGGGGSIIPNQGSTPNAGTPPPAPTPVAEKGCAGRQTNASVDAAILSGELGDLSSDDLFEDIAGQLSCSVEDADEIRAALFDLNDDFQVTSDSLTSLSWDPTHDAAILTPVGDAITVLKSNAVTRDGYDILGSPLVVAGQTETARHMVFGSNPMRTMYRGASAEGMDDFLNNSLAWLTDRDDLDTGNLSVVISQMSQSFYFPDQISVRGWLDTQFETRVSYNEAAACNGADLSQCLADGSDLLIISQSEDGTGTAEAVKAALDAGTPVLYMHHDGGLTDLGAELLPLLSTQYSGDNYWRRQSIQAFDGTSATGKLSDADAALESLLLQLKDDSFDFSLASCEDKSCPDGHGYNTDFLPVVSSLKSLFDGLDKTAANLFAETGRRKEKAVLLLADRFRSETAFPMDKVSTPRGAFLRSMFADHVVHTARSSAPVQADMGNFSRSDFSHVTPVTRDITLVARERYSAAGVYAIPGQTVRVTRTDSSPVNTHIRVNLLRSGATHEFDENQYSRPKHLSSADMPIAAGESLVFTSPYGGPIQVRFDDKDMETEFTFENVGEHAVWRSSADDSDFESKLDAGEFDWAELITPGFQVHSTLEKMRETVNHPVWSSAAQVAEATEKYLHNYPHVLAGLQGDGIDIVPEIHDFADAHGLDIQTLDTVKHMNADQANCGYGCSGNPYDAYWNFNPIGHGDIHELGHGLERGRFRYTNQEGHTSTNYYSYYSKNKFFEEISDSDNLGCQNIPYEQMFNTVQASRQTADPGQYMRDNVSSAWNNGAAINLQLMMAAQDLGLLENGYHLLARQHIIDREFNVADNNDETWAAKKDGLGFGAFTRDEARALSNNDWNLIALSHALDRDLTDYLELWGLQFSDAAKTAVTDKVDFPTDFYVASPKAHCTGFRTDKLPIDGNQNWPLTSKTSAPTEKSHLFEDSNNEDHHAH